MAYLYIIKSMVEDTRLAVFERKILRRIYGPCIDSDTGEWRISHNDELKNLFQKPNIIAEITGRKDDLRV